MAGANNRALTNNFIIGYNNQQDSSGPSFIFGTNNKKVRNTIVIGHDNGTNSYDGLGSSYQGIVIGYNTRSANREGIVLGTNLAGSQYAIGTVVLGTWNKKNNSDYGETERINRTSSAVIIGGGTSNNRLNAIEIDNTGLVAIPHGLCLDNISTTVDAITPPQDPNNITQDDQTLVTVSHMNAEFSKSQVAYFSDYDTALSVPLDNTSVDFATSFGTPPTWANRALITFRWENELIQKEIHFTKNEGIHLNIVQRAYSTFPETVVHKHLRLEWDFTAQTLTAADYWTYDQDMSNNGTISNWDHTLANASVCKVLSVVYSQ